MRRGITTVLVATAALGGSLVPGAEAREVDVVVYGATPAGVTAAVQVARSGHTVILLEPKRHIGGLLASGLGFVDAGEERVIGGVAREFFQRVAEHYDTAEAWRFQARESFPRRGQAGEGVPRTLGAFEPHVAEAVFERMLREAGVEVVRGEALDRRDGVKVQRGAIRSLRTLSGQTYSGRIFIDATYEGDLLAAAGVSYHLGREANEVHGERWNGIGGEGHESPSAFPEWVDPFVEPGNRGSGLLPGVSLTRPGLAGSGDRKLPAYSFRLCLTDVPENRAAFPRPDSYDPGRYELLLRLLATGWREAFDGFRRVPNGKAEARSHGPLSLDLVGESWAYPEATDEDRRSIVLEHERYQKGLVYFLANDPRVPADIRIPMGRWGLARDEFQDNGHWPWQLHIREARRMVGEHVMTEHHCLGTQVAPDPVAMASAPMTSATVQRYVTVQGAVQNEGDLRVELPRPYGISYGSLVPRRAECRNLLVPVAASASHVAYGSLATEAVFMALGHSVGTAATLALEGGQAVQDVDRRALRARLLGQGQILSLP